MPLVYLVSLWALPSFPSCRRWTWKMNELRGKKRLPCTSCVRVVNRRTKRRAFRINKVASCILVCQIPFTVMRRFSCTSIKKDRGIDFNSPFFIFRILEATLYFLGKCWRGHIFFERAIWRKKGEREKKCVAPLSFLRIFWCYSWVCVVCVCRPISMQMCSTMQNGSERVGVPQHLVLFLSSLSPAEQYGPLDDDRKSRVL